MTEKPYHECKYLTQLHAFTTIKTHSRQHQQ